MKLSSTATARIGCIAWATLSGFLLACSSTIEPAGAPPSASPSPNAAQSLEAHYADLASAGERVLRLDPARSQVRILAFRGGKMARLGHNHVLTAPRFQGWVRLPREREAAADFDLVFRLDELVLDEAPVRAELGPAFTGSLDAADIEATRGHLLGEDGLQAQRFPEVRIHGLALRGEAPLYALQAQVELHGQRRELWLPVTVQGLPGSFEAEGRFVLRQSDFGVQPYSILGGALAVQDEVIVTFRLLGAAPPRQP